MLTHVKYLSSVKSNSSLARELEEEHEDEDDEERVKDGLLENITEFELYYFLIGHFFIQGIESCNLVVLSGKSLLKENIVWIFKIIHSFILTFIWFISKVASYSSPLNNYKSQIEIISRSCDVC